MLSIAQTTQESSRFTQDFEDYRRVCRERYAAQQASDVETPSEPAAAIGSDADLSPSVESPNILRQTHPIETTNNSPALNRSVDSVKSSKRRNSLTKVFASLFSKKPDSPEVTREKAKLKAEKEKKEQDLRMAYLVAQLEFSGRSDAEIQMHLFQLRDQAQFASPKMNSVGDLFRSVGQAFKEEFSTRRRSATVDVSELNPFFVAASANYMNDSELTYEELVALESVPRGIKCLDALPVSTYEGQELPSAQTTCAVCMQDFEHSDELRSLHCSHYFHKECIDKWLAIGTNCPVCKGEVEHEHEHEQEC